MASDRLQAFNKLLEGAEGDLPEEIRQKLVSALTFLTRPDDFLDNIMMQLKAKELRVYDREEDGKKHARIVFELVVQKGMTNPLNSIHGGCAAYLVDVCSSVALSLLSIATNGPVELVSQSLNMVYHAGAPVGSKLEIVNVTTSSGSRVVSARTEIWDATHRRLVASGTHIKMKPGAPKPKPKL